MGDLQGDGRGRRRLDGGLGHGALRATLSAALLVLGSAFAGAAQDEPSREAQLLRRFGEELGRPDFDRDALAGIIDEARSAMDADPRDADALSAFGLGCLALAWRESVEGLEEGPWSAELEGWLARSGYRTYFLSLAPKLLGEAIGRNRLEAADSVARWYCDKLDPTLVEVVPILADQVEVKRLRGNAERAEELLTDLEALLAELAEDESLDDFSRLLVARTQTTAWILRSEGWGELGVLDQAMDYAGRALARSQELGHPDRLAASTLAAANVHLESERPKSALRIVDAYLGTNPDLPPRDRRQLELSRAVALAEIEFDEPARERQAADALRALAWSADDLPAARALLELSEVLIRERLEVSSQGALDEEAAEEVTRALDVARAILERSGEARSTERGTLLTMHRARLALATTDDPARLEATLAEVELTLDGLREDRARVIPRPGGIGFLHIAYRRSLLATRTRLLIRLRGKEEGARLALEGMLDVQSEGPLAQQLGVEGVELAALGEGWLGDSHGVLVYLPGRYALHLFAFDGGKPEYFELDPQIRFQESRDRFLAALDTDPAEIEARAEALLGELRKESRILAENLFPRRVRELVESWDTVTIVGSEFLRGLPFECLPLEPGGSLLGVTHAVEHTPSLAVSYGLHRRGAGDAARDLVLATVLRSARVGVAANRGTVTPEQLLSVARRLAGPFEDEERRRILVGDRATWSAVLREASGGVSLLHLLAHGGYDRDRERGACLVLTPDEVRPDGLVFAEDVESASIRAGIVVLAACGTARGPVRLGADNLHHLGGAFLTAGASCVVLTRADVTLDGVVALTDAMQRALVAGVSPAEALRRARAAVAQEGGPLAAFLAGRVQLFGSGSRALGQR